MTFTVNGIEYSDEPIPAWEVMCENCHYSYGEHRGYDCLYLDRIKLVKVKTPKEWKYETVSKS